MERTLYESKGMLREWCHLFPYFFLGGGGWEDEGSLFGGFFVVFILFFYLVVRSAPVRNKTVKCQAVNVCNFDSVYIFSKSSKLEIYDPLNS